MHDYVLFSKQRIAAPEFHILAGYAARIAALLETPQLQSRTSLLACLDDLLGAVYSLMYAKHHGYQDRPQPLGSADMSNVLVRARDMAHLRIRTEGKWTAGFYFNNALFRTSAVYHRVLKILTGNERTRMDVGQLRPIAEGRFKQGASKDWQNEHVREVHKEVNDLKHTSEGIFAGRDVAFDTEVKAVDEILSLVEVLK